jgi:hypothetical protein
VSAGHCSAVALAAVVHRVSPPVQEALLTVASMRALAGTLLVTMLMMRMRFGTSMGRSGMMVTATLAMPVTLVVQANGQLERAFLFAIELQL